MSFSTLRLTRELVKLKKEQLEGVKIIDTNNISKWTAIIKGPPDTPFEKGEFEIELRFGNDYPVKPPSVKFITPMFHPNIYKDGKICVDILQGEWSPVQNIRTILVSLRSLLMDPNPNSPANREAANLLRSDINLYNERVRNLINRKV